MSDEVIEEVLVNQIPSGQLAKGIEERDSGAGATLLVCDEKLQSAVEALIFASEDPISVQMIGKILSDYSRQEIEEAISKIRAEYDGDLKRGIALIGVAGGYQFRTKGIHADLIKALFEDPPMRFSKASLEVMAIVVYRQPITRSEIEKVRGVDSGGVLKTLLERDLIRIIGRSEVVGRPLLYATSEKFLKVFGLPDLNSLPSLAEFEALGRAVQDDVRTQADMETEKTPVFESFHASAAQMDEEDREYIDDMLVGASRTMRAVQSNLKPILAGDAEPSAEGELLPTEGGTEGSQVEAGPEATEGGTASVSTDQGLVEESSVEETAVLTPETQPLASELNSE